MLRKMKHTIFTILSLLVLSFFLVIPSVRAGDLTYYGEYHAAVNKASEWNPDSVYTLPTQWIRELEDDPDQSAEVYIRFGGVGGPDWTARTITAIQINLYVKDVDDDGYVRVYYTTAYNPSTLTWNNRPYKSFVYESDKLTYDDDDTLVISNSLNLGNGCKSDGYCYYGTVGEPDADGDVHIEVDFSYATQLYIVWNDAPTTPTSLSLTNPVRVGNTLTATASGSSDPDGGDGITYYYEFYNVNDGATRQSYSTDNTYVIAIADAHDTMRVRTKAYDGMDYSGEKEATRVVSDTTPTDPTDLTGFPASIEVSDTLTVTATGGTDADADSITYYYKFYGVNDSAIRQDWSTSKSYVIQPEDSGDTIRAYTKSHTSYADSPGNYYEQMNVERMDYPIDPYLEVGVPDGTYEWNYTGSFETSEITENFSAEINSYLALCTADFDGYCDVPLYFTSASIGILQLSNISIQYSYDPNPVTLDDSLVSSFLEDSSGFADIPITFESTKNGTLEISNIKFDYKGGNKTYNILAHSDDYSVNKSYTATYYFSRWDYNLPANIDSIDFYAYSPVVTNIEPFGQSSSIPIMNITSEAYDGPGINFSVLLNQTHSCVNMTIQPNSTKVSNNVMANYTWTTMKSNLAEGSSFGLWMWVDMNCNYLNWQTWEPIRHYRACCVGCDICSEDLV